MSAARRAGEFLTAVWRYLSVAGLYQPDHPYRAAVADEVHDALVALLERDPSPSFSFLAGEVIYGKSPLRHLRAGTWASRMEKAGVARIEAQRGLERQEVGAFLEGLLERMRESEERDRSGEGTAAPLEETMRLPHLRYGPLGIEEDVPAEAPKGEREVTLDVEAGALGWLHEEVEASGTVPVAESLAVVQSLSVAMHGAQRLIVPFLRIKQSDQYTAGHCINVSILSMSLGEELGMPAARVQAVGAAGLLHDIGKVRVPAEILGKPGRLTDEERAVIERHPVDGCRMLMASGPEMALPAIVAYEHHMGWDEGGYPTPHFARRPALLSRLVQVCDFYDALRTRRQYREPLPAPKVIGILEKNAGSNLDPELARAFVEMIRRWDPATILTEGIEGDRGPLRSAAAEPGAGDGGPGEADARREGGGGPGGDEAGGVGPGRVPADDDPADDADVAADTALAF